MHGTKTLARLATFQLIFSIFSFYSYEQLQKSRKRRIIVNMADFTLKVMTKGGKSKSVVKYWYIHYFLTTYLKGAFFTYVDKVVTFVEHLPTPG